jgi:ribosomal protein S18 acetylase RimI-like enzyme
VNNGNFKIIEYEHKYKEAYINLNMGWLKEYNLLEERDITIIENVESEVLEKGGKIFLLKTEGDDIIGTVGLLPQSENTVEIIKLAVDKKYKGFGLGKYLMTEIIKKAYELKFNKIILYTNSKLKVAIKLYEKLGFVEYSIGENNYEEADVKMIYEGDK